MSPAPALTLVVVRCRDLEQSRRFYQAIGLILTAEQHGTGPLHYSSQLGATVLELYPASDAPSNVRLGVCVTDVRATLESIHAVGGRVERNQRLRSKRLLFVIQTTIRLS